MNASFNKLIGIIFFVAVVIASCSKEKTSTPVNPCASKTLGITGAATPTTGGLSNGTLSVTATGSTGFSYNINGGAYQSGGTFSNLAVATYTVGAKDVDGCTTTQAFAVTATPCPTISITATVVATTTPATSNGSITASATGSTGFTYSINNAAFQASGAFAGLAVGSYTITAKDLNGCIGTAVFAVTSASCPTITISATTTPASGPAATNGALSATATGGTAPYTYSKDGGVSFQASGNFTGLTAGNYTIIAKDANACLGTSSTIVVASTGCPTISFTTIILGRDKCINNTGSITINATGSSGYQYNLNGGVFQASNLFGGLASGSYTLGVKDLNGCTVTNTATVGIAPAGPQFTQVKAILAASCALSGCHISPFPQNGIDFTDDCTIVSLSANIKARAVDGSPSFMPPSPNPQLSGTDKQKIIDWINGGGRNNN